MIRVLPALVVQRVLVIDDARVVEHQDGLTAYEVAASEYTEPCMDDGSTVTSFMAETVRLWSVHAHGESLICSTAA